MRLTISIVLFLYLFISCYEDGLIPVSSCTDVLIVISCHEDGLIKISCYKDGLIIPFCRQLHIFIGINVDLNFLLRGWFDSDYCVFRRRLHGFILFLFTISTCQTCSDRLLLSLSVWCSNDFYCFFSVNFDWMVYIDRFTKLSWTISIGRLIEITRTISIDWFIEISQTVSICGSFCLLTSGGFFWIMLRIKIIFTLSLPYLLYQYLSLELVSFLVVIS